MRKIKAIHEAIREDIADLMTYRVMPTSSIRMIDPFLFLNHHGRQTYSPGNGGLPFGPHPHRGFETVTFILEGDIFHKDTGGAESVIKDGGVQWMTAGKGLVHSETSSEEFKRNGGSLEILQLWVNLPSRLKMTNPQYTGLQKGDIPHYSYDNGKVSVELVSGEWGGHIGPFRPLTDVTSLLLNIQPEGITQFTIQSGRNIFFYVIKGKIKVNGSSVSARQLVEFENNSDLLEIIGEENSKILLCHAPPLREPVVSYGPFVMNTREEIMKAIQDYESGRLS